MNFVLLLVEERFGFKTCKNLGVTVTMKRMHASAVEGGSSKVTGVTINTRIVKHDLAIGKGVVRGHELNDPHQERND